MTRWVTGRGGKDAHRRCFQRMLEVFWIFSDHFQTQAAGPAGWMIFKCPEPPRVNPTLTQPVARLFSAASCIKCGFPLLWALASTPYKLQLLFSEAVRQRRLAQKGSGAAPFPLSSVYPVSPDSLLHPKLLLDLRT